MKKGSPSGYDAETGEESASSESLPGEPHECSSLYWIRCSQENHQFLRQDRSRRNRGRRQHAGRTRGPAGMGRSATSPWRGAMEATLFSGWIYDTLKPYGEQLEMAHPAKMKAISAGKKKSDTIDARTIADLVRCNLLPACYVAPPRIRELRRLLRYRSLVVSEAVRMKNKMAGLLMETGAVYVKEKLHRKKYFASLLEELEEVPESVIDLLRLSRGALEMFEIGRA